MTLVNLFSLAGMVLGLGGIVPQLVRMIRARSAAGQAPLGWGMGLAANISMAYVNAVAFDSSVLTAYSVTAGSLCAVAIGLIAVLGRQPAPPADDFGLEEMATQEFVLLREAVLSADRARA